MTHFSLTPRFKDRVKFEIDKGGAGVTKGFGDRREVPGCLYL